MHTIKTAALTFIAIFACLILLLTPDSNRIEAPAFDALPVQLDSAATSQSKDANNIELAQPVTFAFDEIPPVEQDKPEFSTTSSTTTQSIDWALVLYPELVRIEALENQPADLALGELVPMLASDDPVIRLAAIESVGDMTIPAAANVLVSALNDPNPQLRVAAIEALASQESAMGSIELFLYDEDRTVRIAAIEALADFEAESAVYALAGLLSDPDAEIRRQAVSALGEIGGEEAASFLHQAQFDIAESVRASAADILAEIELEIAN